MLLLKMKLVSALLGVSASAGHVHSGRHPMVARQSADRYAVIGEGVLRTVGCTVSADLSQDLSVRVGRPDRRGHRWVTFLDRSGAREADDCMVDDGPDAIVARVSEVHAVIRRGVATADGN